MTQTIKEAWAVFKSNKISHMHYLIQNGTRTICGHVDIEIYHYKYKFASKKQLDKLSKCGLCEKDLPAYIKNGHKTGHQILEEQENARLDRVFKKYPELQFKNDYLIVTNIKCSEPGCKETGCTIIKNTETINSNPHYCLKHNKTIGSGKYPQPQPREPLRLGAITIC